MNKEILTNEQKSIVSIYLDYVNNYMSIEKFANDYGINEILARYIIDAGRNLNDR